MEVQNNKRIKGILVKRHPDQLTDKTGTIKNAGDFPSPAFLISYFFKTLRALSHLK
jgi:hypothetical protein